MENKISICSNLVLICFIVALGATLGSLFFSEVMDFIPCSMCWYQRIFMYPLVLIFLIALLYPDDKLFKYSMPLVIVGGFFAIYHNFLMFGLISEDAVPCVQGVPCSTEYINWFGFIHIPLLSLISYSVIFIALVIGQKSLNKKSSKA